MPEHSSAPADVRVEAIAITVVPAVRSLAAAPIGAGQGATRGARGPLRGVRAGGARHSDCDSVAEQFG